MANKKIADNFLWRFTERLLSHGSNFVVSVVLARLLAPEAHGTLALVTVFTTLLQAFVFSGLGTALVQKKDADEIDFSTVFFFELGMSFVLYFGLFFCAPLISVFYERPELTPLLRVTGLSLVFSALQDIQFSYVSRNLIFKRSFFATLLSTVLSGGLGIAMAALGFGVWALVGQHLSLHLVCTVFMWATVRWRPILRFSFSRLKGLLSFSWKILATALLDATYKDLQTLIIGKKYTSSDLAFRDKGNIFPNVITTSINTTLDSILLPVLSKHQDNPAYVKQMMRRAMKTGTFVIFPLMIGLCMCAEDFIRLLLTDVWLPAVPFLRIFCFAYLFHPIQTTRLGAFKALGRSDLSLKIELMRKGIGLACLLPSIPFGIMAMAQSLLVSELLTAVICTFVCKHYLGLTVAEQVSDILPNFALTLLMGLSIVFLPNLLTSAILTLLLQVCVAVLVYVLGAHLLRFESLTYLLELLKNYLPKKKKAE